jgi:hypothetical protein
MTPAAHKINTINYYFFVLDNILIHNQIIYLLCERILFYFLKCCRDNIELSVQFFYRTAFGVIIDTDSNLEFIAVMGDALDDFCAALLGRTVDAEPLCLGNQCGLDLLELADVSLLDLAVLLADGGQFFQQDP